MDNEDDRTLQHHLSHETNGNGFHHGTESSPQLSKTTSPMRSVHVLWDLDNVRFRRGVSPTQTLSALKAAVARYGRVETFKCYYIDGQLAHDDRVALRNKRIQAEPVPSRKPTAADIHILTDIVRMVARHREPFTLVLISSDEEFAPVLEELMSCGHTVVLLHHHDLPDEGLLAATSEHYSWTDFLGLPEPSLSSPIDDSEDQLTGILSGANSSSSSADNAPSPSDELFAQLSHPFSHSFAPLSSFSDTLLDDVPSSSSTTSTFPGLERLSLGQDDPVHDTTTSFSLPLITSDLSRSSFFSHTGDFHTQATSSALSTIFSTNTTSLANGTEVASTTAFSTDELVGVLRIVLDSLRRDRLMPKQRQVELRWREYGKQQGLELPDFTLVADRLVRNATDMYTEGRGYHRVFWPGQPYSCADYNRPACPLSARDYAALVSFLQAEMPREPGRHGIARFLQTNARTPETVRALPLGDLLSLVQYLVQDNVLFIHPDNNITLHRRLMPPSRPLTSFDHFTPLLASATSPR